MNTCSIAFADPAFDESAYAQQVADRYGTRHFVDRVESDDFDLIDRLAAVYDEPYADSSAIPTYRVCELARRHVTVALSGDGGDESFGGYRRYRLHLMEERLRAPLPLAMRRPVFGLLGRLYPKADWAPRAVRAKTTFEALARDSVEAYFHSMSIMRDAMRARLFTRFVQGAARGVHRARGLPAARARANHDDPLALIQYLDLKTYLVGDINTKVDRASMAHALEVREPLMDHPLVEWLATLPSSLKIRGGEEVLLQARDGTEAAARAPVPAEDGLRGPARRLVPRAAARAAARRGAQPGARGHGVLRRRVRRPAGDRASVGTARPQRAALVAADVRGVPTHGRRRGGRASRRTPAPHGRRLGRRVSAMSAVAERRSRPGRATGASLDPAPIRLLTFTTLFPSQARPRHGIFVETRLKHLLATNAVTATVVAPVPWFPSAARLFGDYGAFARTPRLERRGGVEVRYPRYLMIPKVGMRMQPWALAHAAEREIRRLARDGLEFDLIDAHYFYPDGVAAAMLARRLGKPFIVTARGSDINRIARLAAPGRLIQAAARAATRVVAVSQALGQAMRRLGVAPDRIVVLRNGVDLELFRPVDRGEARRALGLGDGKVLVSVGNLVPLKRHDLFIEAVAGSPGIEALIVGNGPERRRLLELIARAGVADRVRILDEMPQEGLRLCTAPPMRSCFARRERGGRTSCWKRWRAVRR